MKVKSNGVWINYEISGEENGAVIMLSHSLGCNLEMWEPQVAMLEKRFRVLRYDMRGHGKSDAPAGKYTFETLGEDAIGLLDELKIDRVHWIGLSMGGMIGQCLALNYPERLSSLVLCDTGAYMPEEAQPIWQGRINEAREKGMGARVKSTLEDWFTPEYLEEKNPNLEKIRQQLITTPVDGYIACIWALRELNYLSRLSDIDLPTLIIVGDKDFGTPVEASKAMQEQINGSELVIIPDAAHLSSVARPEEFNKAISDFLERLSANE